MRSFGSKNVVIPYPVLEELDRFKTREGEIGKNARQVVRALNELRKSGSLCDGVVVTPKGGVLTVVLCTKTAGSKNLDFSLADDRILSVALQLKEPAEGREAMSEVVLVTKDINLSVKAESLGLEARDFNSDKLVESASDLYKGVMEAQIPAEMINDICSGLGVYTSDIADFIEKDVHANQYMTLSALEDPGKTILARAGSPDEPVKMLKSERPHWGVVPRNREQHFAFDALMDPKIPLVTLMGLAGSGKSLMALACALEQVHDLHTYDRLVVSRPVQPMGKDIGYLPGPQPLDAKVLTPNGWVTMGALKVGDEVVSRDGKPTKVLGIYPKGTKEVYKVTTTEGSSTECCEDHLWYTQTAENRKRKKEGSVKSTREIMESIEHFPKGTKINGHRPKYGEVRPNHFLPRNEPIRFNRRDLPIPAYTMGCLLGDGSMTSTISVSNKDEDILDRISKEITPIGLSLTKSGDSITYNIVGTHLNNKPGKAVRIENIKTGEVALFDTIGRALKEVEVKRGCLHHRCANNSEIDGFKYSFLPSDRRWTNQAKEACYQLGVLGCNAKTKFIPEDYLYSDVEDRMSLLQGLMDTDGTVKKNGESSFCTISKDLAEGMVKLVRSLGGRAKISSRDRVGKSSVYEDRQITCKNVSYEFTVSLPEGISPFYTTRKAERVKKPSYLHGIGIVSIESVGEKKVQCILVENEEHLYITDDYLVTHNTVQEKLDPWMGPLKDSISFLTKGNDAGNNMYDHMVETGMLEVEALTYIRGRSIPNTLFLLDEAQDLSRAEIKTIISRMGENSKLIITGDVMQISNPYLDSTNTGLASVVERFKAHSIAAHVTLSKGERSPLATLASNIL
jgi:predicted ribonuclease YlaK